MEFDDAMKAFAETVNVPDPALDQVFAACRDAFAGLGITNITSRESMIALAILTTYLGAPEETRVAITAYLGTLLDRKETDG